MIDLRNLKWDKNREMENIRNMRCYNIYYFWKVMAEDILEMMKEISQIQEAQWVLFRINK